MKTSKSANVRTVLPLLLASVILLSGCETAQRYDTAQSTCLVLPACPPYPQEFKSSLADEIEQSTANELQVRVIIDYDLVCKKLDIARNEICEI